MNDFDEYIRAGEPGRVERAQAWQTAIGLQAVDGLKPSQYLIETARRHIEGDITIDEAGKLINSYYERKDGRLQDADTEEADIVSERISKVLLESGFHFSSLEYLNIHRRLFEGLLKNAGKLRTYNISKKEWVLDGQSVEYGHFEMLRANLEYDFEQEKNFSYASLSVDESLAHLAKFISDVWQNHVFSEGNTRTTAVFLIKYLRTFGFKVNNDLFKEKSAYFRDALVRANFNNFNKGIKADMAFLLKFMRNLILGENNALMDREMHIKYAAPPTQSINGGVQSIISKYHFDTLNLSMLDLAILNCIERDAKMTQTAIAREVGKSAVTIKRATSSLVERGILVRKNGKRDGWWEINAGRS
ncbi:MAG: Fic family protein [Bacteroides sp.]|nr:Fic family protein [Ruminococcus flavefaciens]MCM1555744.1 Fic family protein [Bacteroides sp.]